MDEFDPHDRGYLELRHVHVPEVRYNGWRDRIVQQVKTLLVPTTSRAFRDKDEYFTRLFADQVDEYSQVRQRTKQLFLVSRSQRLSQLKALVEIFNLPTPPAQWTHEVHDAEQSLPQPLSRSYQVIEAVPPGDYSPSPEDIELLDEYCTTVKRTHILRLHLQDIDQDLEAYTRTINTQATAECTYFRGFRDWCQVMAQLTGGLSTALIAVSTLGAGLVYSTVFGATRGDIGAMCYCFPFFSCGFLLPVIMQLLLQWGASLQREIKFASQQIWTIIIAILMSISSLAVIASLTILNVTVFRLKTDTSGTMPDPPSTPVPGIIAFGITGSVFLLILVGMLLAAISLKVLTTLKGMRVIVAAMYGNEDKHVDALKVWLPV
ncbi:hypothetical protein B0H16DRAFT_1005751 [Mycena metata]|uniref:Uncharacterized protein n=1 Tax=Mycena metata TaxID=1033252 RepID=A0AAD7K1I8_9AGAR|nr:hypothetical protein B0H16DRAFT_1005751 [Mycena metata]